MKEPSTTSFKESAVDWPSMFVGTAIGAVAGVLVQNIAFPQAMRLINAARQRRYYEHVNRSWRAVEQLYMDLRLVRSGWELGGYFPEGTAKLRLEGKFQLQDAALIRIRDEHQPQWLAQRMHDSEQVGIRSFEGGRTNDEPDKQVIGQTHNLEIIASTFRYFDYLATHNLLRGGTKAEQESLQAVMGTAAETPVAGFPNPCSVGLSLFCEKGAVLVLTRRSKAIAGGEALGGKLFNAVGETVNGRDFKPGLSGQLQTTPDEVARRGLWEEMGLSDQDIRDCHKLAIHSFAWARDIRDHKFFGLCVTPLAREMVKKRWLESPDGQDEAERFGIRPGDLTFVEVRTRADCLDLLHLIKRDRHDWTPEAIFCTLRSLMIYKSDVLAADDLPEVFGVQRRQVRPRQPR